ncbi:MAG: SDR family oxidoreductase [Myxococcota bacterium]|nr:SDR family oxidoreductase [Myxococcota bacterium]
MSQLQRNVVVTGASKGIGRAIAERFAASGHRVWALARSKDALDSLAAAYPGRVVAMAVDIERVDAVLDACAQLRSEGPPDVLVNNAGVAVSAPLRKTSLEDYERLMAVNVRAPFLFCRELSEAMAERGSGRIINIASTAGLKGFRYTSAYCASKHALVGMTRSLALELASRQVTVNAVCPGWTDTEMVTRSAETISRTTGKTTDEARETLARMNPMGRLVQPSEVAELCHFLASDAAGAITGATYSIDAGETI